MSEKEKTLLSFTDIPWAFREQINTICVKECVTGQEYDMYIDSFRIVVEGKGPESLKTKLVLLVKKRTF